LNYQYHEVIVMEMPAPIGSSSNEGLITNTAHENTVPVNWRIGQGIALALIALLALAFNLWTGRAANAAPRGVADQLGFLALAVLVIQMTPNAGVIALSTFQEAWRRRFVTTTLGLSAAVLLLGSTIQWSQAAEGHNFLRDFGTGFIILTTMLIAIFLGVSLVPPEVERRTVFTILSKPVSRLEYLLGKFLGLVWTLFVYLFLLGVAFLIGYAIYRIRDLGYNAALEIIPGSKIGLKAELGNLATALVLHYGQLVIIASLALAISLVTSSITAVVFCFMVYFGGQMSSYWEQLGSGSHTATTNHEGISKPMQGLINFVYWSLPRLDKFDVRERLVTDQFIGLDYAWRAWNSGLIYVAILLIIAAMVWSDREF
jgi:ABC-type transport system involved in multi-copper enzyme maturation permease subunit